MGKKKNPFKGFTIEEVLRAESESFVIRIGKEFYNKDGNFVFSYNQACKHYEILLANIIVTLSDGNEKQRITARKCLETLQVLPLRIQ